MAFKSDFTNLCKYIDMPNFFKKIFHFDGSLLKCSQQSELGQTETPRSLEFHCGLRPGWQRPSNLDQHLQPSQACQHQVESEAKKPRLELASDGGCAYPKQLLNPLYKFPVYLTKVRIIVYMFEISIHISKLLTAILHVHCHAQFFVYIENTHVLYISSFQEYNALLAA